MAPIRLILIFAFGFSLCLLSQWGPLYVALAGLPLNLIFVPLFGYVVEFFAQHVGLVAMLPPYIREALVVSLGTGLQAEFLIRKLCQFHNRNKIVSIQGDTENKSR